MKRYIISKIRSFLGVKPKQEKLYLLEYSLAFPIGEEDRVRVEESIFKVTLPATSDKDAERKLLAFARKKLQVSVRRTSKK